MPRCITPSFACEFPLKAGLREVAVLGSRFEAARQLGNAVLGETQRRLARVRRDPAFEVAKALPRGSWKADATSEQKAQSKVRQDAFRTVKAKHGFEEWGLHAYSSLTAGSWIRDHLDINTAQKMASRVFKAVERWSYGQAGKPRFKRHGEVVCVEGKSNLSGIRFRFQPEGNPVVLWNGTFADLRMEVVVDPEDPFQAHALALAREGKVKYVRILLRTIRGRRLVYAQLVLEGHPLRKLKPDGALKHPTGDALVGLDLGPSEVAIVTEGQAEKVSFCPGLDRKEKRRKKYQRKLDRQRRANNPDNYEADGQVKPNAERKPWKASKSQMKTRASLADLQRAMAGHRKSLQGTLVHRVLARGNRLKSEKCNKRAWAKNWGRSVGHKAPGMFQARLGVLAEASGGSTDKISTRTSCLSSRCLCGLRRKKPLKEREHTCGCAYVPEGMQADRDEFSAFLALFCQEGVLDEGAAREAWRAWRVDILLHASSREGCGSRSGGASSSHRVQTANEGALLPKRKAETARRSRSQRRDRSGRKAPGAVLPGGERVAKIPVPAGGAHAPPGTLAF
jgi:hypothetical protein